MSSGLLLALVFLFGESPAQAESRQDVQLTISNLESTITNQANTISNLENQIANILSRLNALENP